MSKKELTIFDNMPNVKLTSETVRSYLVNGGGNVTDQEVTMFMQLCKHQKLNPFIREAYLIKYGSYPATTIVGKDIHVKRAMRHPKYEGRKVWNDGKVPDLTATAEVHVKGFKFPFTVPVDYSEYVQMKGDKPNSMWKSKPKTMLKKVALVQALREAFPEELSQLYIEEEIKPLEAETETREPMPTETKVEETTTEEIEEAEVVKEEKKTPVKKETPVADKSQDDVSQKCYALIADIIKTVETTSEEEIVKDCSKFVGKDKKEVFETSIANLAARNTDKWLLTTYGKIKKMHEEFVK